MDLRARQDPVGAEEKKKKNARTISSGVFSLFPSSDIRLVLSGRYNSPAVLEHVLLDELSCPDPELGGSDGVDAITN